MANFFVRFSNRPSGNAFRSMLKEQLELIEERVRETGNAEMLNDAATALVQLFGAAKNRWSVMTKADR
eukprot:852407-Alexandrium_andersonii.AAC.1